MFFLKIPKIAIKLSQTKTAYEGCLISTKMDLWHFRAYDKIKNEKLKMFGTHFTNGNFNLSRLRTFNFHAARTKS